MADPVQPVGAAPPARHWLCAGADLHDSARAVPFEVRYVGRVCPAFAIRYQGQVHAYLNQCAHVPIELDFQPGHFFDASGHWLVCATHGATYTPDSGHCSGGPCRGGLVKIEVSEQAGQVPWHTSPHIQAIEFPS